MIRHLNVSWWSPGFVCFGSETTQAFIRTPVLMLPADTSRILGVLAQAMTLVVAFQIRFGFTAWAIHQANTSANALDLAPTALCATGAETA